MKSAGFLHRISLQPSNVRIHGIVTRTPKARINARIVCIRSIMGTVPGSAQSRIPWLAYRRLKRALWSQRVHARRCPGFFSTMPGISVYLICRREIVQPLTSLAAFNIAVAVPPDSSPVLPTSNRGTCSNRVFQSSVELYRTGSVFRRRNSMRFGQAMAWAMGRAHIRVAQLRQNRAVSVFNQ